jgi:hypothetical protein
MAASGAYASALGGLRDTVKWIMAAFTGVGAIVFSGLTITNISTLAEAGQWLIPVALAAIPLLAAVWATIEALRVINATPAAIGALFPHYWASLGGTAVDAVPDTKELKAELPNAIGAYGTPETFDRTLKEAYGQVEWARQLLAAAADDDSRRDGFTKAVAHLDGLQATVKETLDCVAYVEGRRQFRTFAWRTLIAAVIALAGLVASGVVTGDLLVASAQATPAPTAFTSPTPVQVWLSESPPATAGGPHGCPLWNGMSALAVGGTVSRPVLLFPGYSSSVARSHGITSAAPQCADPWLWSTVSGEVLVEPR